MSDSRIKYVEMMQSIIDDGVSFSTLKNEVSDKKLAFCNMLIMTSFRHLNFIKQSVIPLFVKKKIPNKQRILNYVLFLGITELLFMDTPDYAVLNSYVEVAKKKTDRYGANFINAILRNVLRHKDDLLSVPKNNYFGNEFRKILKKDYSDKLIQEMEQYAGIEPPLDITLKHDAEPFGGMVLENGTFRFPANTKVVELPYYTDGKWWVQDAAASMVVKCMGNIKGKKILDVCSAPGGKTAQLLDSGAQVTALDISETRLQTLQTNMERLKFSDNLNIICTNALDFQSECNFDIILLDAPCSATGTFRRHPEIMHTKSFDDVQKQARLQQKILEHIINFLSPDGKLFYATCSLAHDEGEKQILNFTKKHTEFEIKKISLKGTDAMQTSEGFLRILPQHLANEGGIDGFFIACLQRKI